MQSDVRVPTGRLCDSRAHRGMIRSALGVVAGRTRCCRVWSQENEVEAVGSEWMEKKFSTGLPVMAEAHK